MRIIIDFLSLHDFIPDSRARARQQNSSGHALLLMVVTIMVLRTMIWRIYILHDLSSIPLSNVPFSTSPSGPRFSTESFPLTTHWLRKDASHWLENISWISQNHHHFNDLCAFRTDCSRKRFLSNHDHLLPTGWKLPVSSFTLTFLMQHLSFRPWLVREYD